MPILMKTHRYWLCVKSGSTLAKSLARGFLSLETKNMSGLYYTCQVADLNVPRSFASNTKFKLCSSPRLIKSSPLMSFVSYFHP